MAKKLNPFFSLLEDDAFARQASVAADNQPPVVNDEFASLYANTSVSAHESLLLANDSDPDGDALRIASYTDPAHGTLSRAADGTLTYTPTPGFSGNDSFTYMVIDGQGVGTNGTVNLTVLPAAPIAGDDYVSLPAGTSISGNESVLLANDRDPDGGPLTISSYGQPANGTLTRAADGTLTYTPRAGFTGTDSFTYTLTDNQGATDVGQVFLTVTGAPPRVIGTPNVSIVDDANNDGSISRVELAGQTRVDVSVNLPQGAAVGDELLVLDNLGNGVSKTLTAADLVAGHIEFADAFPLPVPGATITVSAKLSDALGNASAEGSDTAVFDGNYAPVASDDTASLRLGVGFPQLGGNVLANDNDPDGAAGSLRVAGVANNPNVTPGVGVGQVLEGTYGHLTVNPDGSYTYVADKAGNLAASVTDVFYYVDQDAGSASSNIARLTIQVDPSLASVVSVSSPTVEEGADLIFTVATSAAAAPTTVTLALTSGTATVGVDTPSSYQVNFGAGWQNVVGNSVQVAANTTSFQIKLATTNDTLLESRETVFLKAVSADGSTATGSGTIVDNDLAAMVSGVEDTPLALTWANFNLGGVNAPTAKLVVESLPVDGKLQYNNNGSWTAATIGQQISKADIDAGKLRFMPDLNESGSDAYNAPGVGNQLNDYARFGYGADDGAGVVYTHGTMSVDIAPKAETGQTATPQVVSHGYQPSPLGSMPAGYSVLITFNLSDAGPADADGSERTRVGMSNVKDYAGTPQPVYTSEGAVVVPDAHGVAWVDPSKSYYIQSAYFVYSMDYVVARQEVTAAGVVLDEAVSPSRHWIDTSPLVLDLNGDGVQTVSVEHGAYFDLNANGARTQTGWASREDGFLVRDIDGNGLIDDGRELFGSATRLADGSSGTDGFVALGDLDANHDARIDAGDAGFTELQVWQDANGDGFTQGGELHSLGSLGIIAFNLAPTVTSIAQNGNTIGLLSSYVTADGQTHELADVWFTGNGNTQPAESLNAADLLGGGSHHLDALMGGSPAAQAPAAAIATAPAPAALPAPTPEALAQLDFAVHMPRFEAHMQSHAMV